MLFKKLISRFQEMISYLEEAPLPFIYFLITFLSAVTLRNFLEQLVFDDCYVIDLKINHYHYYASYVCLALVVILLLYGATKTPIKKITRTILSFFFLINIVPLIDLIVMLASKTSYSLGYMFPDVHKHIFLRYLTFFGPFDGLGVTPGQRAEVALILIAIFAYIKIKGSGILKSLLFTFIAYTVLFFLGCLPFHVTFFVNLFNLKCNLTSELMLYFYLLLIIFLFTFVLYLHAPKKTIIFFKALYSWRTFYFESMFIIGICILGFSNSKGNSLAPEHLSANGWGGFFAFTQETLFQGIFLVFAIGLGCALSEIIKSVSKNEGIGDFRTLAWILGGGALLYSCAVNYLSFFIMLLFIGNDFICYLPPLSLKKVPFAPVIFFLINTSAVILMGYLFYAKHFESFLKM